MRVFEGHTSFVFCVACSPLSTLLVSGSYDETIRLWDLQRGTCHRTIAAHAEAVTGVDFSRDGAIIASCSHDGLIRLWSTSEGHCLRTLQHDDKAPVTFVQFSPSSLQLLTMSLDNAIRLWDLPNARVLKTYTGHANQKYAIAARFVASPPRGHQPRVYVVSGSEDRRVYVWDLQTKKVLQTLDGHRDTVVAISVRPTTPVALTPGPSDAPADRIWRAGARRERDRVARPLIATADEYHVT